MRSGKVILGTLAGIAIGAIAGILFAPEKGSKTRKQIKGKSDDYVDGFKSKFDKFSDSVTEKLEKGKKEAEHLALKGNAKYEESKKEAARIAEEGKDNLKDAKNLAKNAAS